MGIDKCQFLCFNKYLNYGRCEKDYCFVFVCIFFKIIVDFFKYFVYIQFFYLVFILYIEFDVWKLYWNEFLEDEKGMEVFFFKFIQVLLCEEIIWFLKEESCGSSERKYLLFLCYF